MMDYLLSFFSRASPKLRSTLYKPWYQFLARVYQKTDWNFMNYGYAPLSDQNKAIKLSEEDGYYRYHIQLYDHVAGTVDLRDLKVLEVGSGRGGGADYIKRYLKPEIMMGVDFSENAVKFCNEKYDLEGLFSNQAMLNLCLFQITVLMLSSMSSLPIVIVQWMLFLVKLNGFFVMAGTF